LAASNGHVEAVKFLVNKASADVESKDHNGRTPLSWAAYWGHLDAVKLLVNEAGANITVKDNRGHTALHLARQGAQQCWGDREGCRAVAAWLEKKEKAGREADGD